MATALDRFKIGVLVIVAFIAAVLITIGLGVEVIPAKSVAYRSYFDESVQGLDVGAPVKIRGVSIGQVTDVRLAPDRRHVEVTLQLVVDELRRLGIATGPEHDKLALVADLRAQIAALGLSGVKFVDLVFVDERLHPRPELPFPVPDEHIPATPSTLTRLESAAVRVADTLPRAVEELAATAARLDHLLEDLEREDVSGKATHALARTDAVLEDLERTLRAIERARIGERSARTLDELERAAAKVNAALDRIDGEEGLLASATRAADAIGALGRGTSPTARELESTMRGIREAADALRVLAESLERDPDMLLKGRAKARSTR
jgi:ABC-type transporter Mla subunit MlaD